MAGMGGDHATAHLKLVNEQLKQERDILQRKVDDLQSIISEKNKEINELRKNGTSGSGNEAIENLARTNERLMQELTKM
jgi:predicted RNase H-like nuclease (RuvC/YqgF family)